MYRASILRLAPRKVWSSRHLPKMKGLNLSIAGGGGGVPPLPETVKVTLVPEWREDALLESSQWVGEGDAVVSLDTSSVDATTTISAFVSVEEEAAAAAAAAAAAGSSSKSKKKKVLASSCDVADGDWPSTPYTSSSAGPGEEPPPPSGKLEITLRVPSKLDLSARLDSGDVEIPGKLEGHDILVTTGAGEINVDKLRAHRITLSAGGGGGGTGFLGVKRLVEAEDAKLRGAMVHAKMISGRNVSVDSFEPFGTKGRCRRDGDHEQQQQQQQQPRAKIDVGSLYVSGSQAAAISALYDSSEDECPCAVRIKSNHGAVDVDLQVKSRSAVATIDDYGTRVGLVELGGVSGECSVSVKGEETAPQSSSDEDEESGPDGDEDDVSGRISRRLILFDLIRFT